MTCLVINIAPDLFNGMMKGVINALGIQHKAVFANIIAHWIYYPISIYVFAFRLNMGVFGLWFAHIGLESLMFVMYTYIINSSDWVNIAEEAEKR
jgi:Na+-driven multidrug efflux pump